MAKSPTVLPPGQQTDVTHQELTGRSSKKSNHHNERLSVCLFVQRDAQGNLWAVDKDWKSLQRLVCSQLKHRVMFLVQHGSLMRGDNMRGVRLKDLCFREVTALVVPPKKCFTLRMRLDHSKTNQVIAQSLGG